MIEVETGKPIWAMGFMTGTSMDGVDGATLLTDGETIFEFGPAEYEAFTAHHRLSIERAIAWATSMPTSDLKIAKQQSFKDIVEIRALTETLDETIARSVINLSSQSQQQTNAPRGGEIAGVHGQTISHRPDEGLTIQIGVTPKCCPVACVQDFRTADVATGGEGAPLAPFYHFALAKFIGALHPIAFLNIGGVGNVTWVDPSKSVPSAEGALVAFDTGPGNALIDDWIGALTSADMDLNGTSAGLGTVHVDRLNSNSAQAYLDRRPPKSLDRNDFHGVLAAMEGLSVNDGAATLTAFTAQCVAESVHHMPSPPTRWLVCGGGRHNKTMMRMLQDCLDAPVEPVEAVGLDGDMLEAQAFAYLAVRVLRGLPTSAPSTTGCREPVCGGRISYPT